MLTPCPECRRQVSSLAQSCPQCGHPVSRESKGPDAAVIIPKKYKLQNFFAWLLIAAGFFLGLYNLYGNERLLSAAVIMFLAGIIWLQVTNIRVWWDS